MEALGEVADGSVQTCVTSPPYYGLRNYGVDGQLGMEPTPKAYVENLVSVFREVRRCLRDDGTLWLNLGDSYNSSGGHSQAEDDGRANRAERSKMKGANVQGLKPKDLIGIPWRVAFALQDDGWYLRSDIVWAKSNPMPESVLDRPTRSHEYLFLLTKSDRYHYDHFAVREEAVGDSPKKQWRDRKARGESLHHGILGAAACGSGNYGSNGFRNKRDVWTVATKPCSWEFCKACDTLFRGPERKAITKAIEAGKHIRVCPCGAADQWVDHFAAYPKELIEPCVLAGTSPQGKCSRCGSPWRRMVDRTSMVIRPGARQGEYGSSTTDSLSGTMVAPAKSEHAGWSPSCVCGFEKEASIPCVVMDPFCGSGTTGAVAAEHGLDFVGCEINPDYARVSEAIISRAEEKSRKLTSCRTITGQETK